VISESAYACACDILRCCRSPRLVPLLAQYIKDKHKDLRNATAGWVRTVVETWEPQEYSRGGASEALKAALSAGLQDASSEVRVVCRDALSVLATKSPSLARSLLTTLEKVDPASYVRVQQALQAHSRPGSAASQRPSSRCSDKPSDRSTGRVGVPKSTTTSTMMTTRMAKTRRGFGSGSELALDTTSDIPSSASSPTHVVSQQQHRESPLSSPHHQNGTTHRLPKEEEEEEEEKEKEEEKVLGLNPSISGPGTQFGDFAASSRGGLPVGDPRMGGGAFVFGQAHAGTAETPSRPTNNIRGTNLTGSAVRVPTGKTPGKGKTPSGKAGAGATATVTAAAAAAAGVGGGGGGGGGVGGPNERLRMLRSQRIEALEGHYRIEPGSTVGATPGSYTSQITSLVQRAPPQRPVTHEGTAAAEEKGGGGA